MGTRLRREGSEGSEGKVDGLSGDEYKVSVTGLAFFVICLDRQSADWLTAFATLSGCAGLPPKGETTHYDLCVAGAPSNHVRCASTGKRVTRFSGRFASLRIVFPCHPYAGGRIGFTMLSCRDIVPLLNFHSPTTEWWQGDARTLCALL